MTGEVWTRLANSVYWYNGTENPDFVYWYNGTENPDFSYRHGAP